MNNNTKDINEQIISLRKEGLMQREIAERLSVTRKKVRYTLEKAGMKNFKYKKVCKNCDRNYETIKIQSKFCSESCRGKYNKRNRGNTYTCRYCGDIYKGYKERPNCTDSCKVKEEREVKQVKELMKRFIEAINPNRHKRCKYCDVEFYADRLNKVYCSERCAIRYKEKRYNHKCRECGKHYTDNQKNSAGCSDMCKRKHANRTREINRYRRIKMNGQIHWTISLERLIKRDKGICHICNNKVDTGVHYNDDYYPSIDHVKPIAKGGTHTWDNVKLAHRICNTYKSDETKEHNNEQLTLL